MSARMLIVLLLISIFICEIHKFTYWIYPETYYIQLDLFLSKNYHQKINVLWYIHELSEIMSRSIVAFVLYKGVSIVSSKMATVALVLMWYYVTQSIFYVWNRNTSFFNNFCVYICMGTVIFLILKPEKKQGKYRNIE